MLELEEKDFINNEPPNDVEHKPTMSIDEATQKVKEKFEAIDYIDTNRLQPQLDLANRICKSFYEDGKKYVLLQAPTGAGKSIIGILVAEIFSVYNNDSISSYFCTATKVLQEQLNRDFETFKISGQVLKGQSNYKCEENGRDFTKRMCSSLSLKKANLLPCAKKCEYLVKRNIASISNIADFSYSYWLTYFNMAYGSSLEPLFGIRRLNIFDEAHTMRDHIISASEITIKLSFFKSMASKIKSYRLERTSKLNKEVFGNLKNYLTNDITKEYMQKLSLSCSKYVDSYIEEMEEILPKEKSLWTNEYKKDFELHEKMSNFASRLHFFTSIDEDLIHREVSKNENGETIINMKVIDHTVLFEPLVAKYTDKVLLMSATLGDIEYYAKNQLKLTEGEYSTFDVDTDFNWGKSPILIVGKPFISMGSKHKESNMSELIRRVDIISQLWNTNKGIIHTGSFDIQKEIFKYAKSRNRMLLYANSDEKEWILNKHRNSKNTILSGPSLMEGISLDDDLCRFSIIAKIPFQYIKDPVVERYMEIDKNWYSWFTGLHVTQAIGRGNRHKNDWSRTYILDKLWFTLLNGTKLPSYIMNRVEKIGIDELIKEANWEDDEIDELLNF